MGLLNARLAHELSAPLRIGITPPDVGVRHVEVRGKVEQPEVLPVEDPASLLLPPDTSNWDCALMSGMDDRAVAHIAAPSCA